VMIVWGAVAQAGDVKVKATITTGPGEEEVTTFAADSPKVFAMFKTEGVQKGDKVRGVWMAENVGSAAPANSKIDEKTLTLEGDTDDGGFSLSKPTKGWPPGKYRLEIYVNDKLATTAKFTVKGNAKTETEPAESAASKESEEGGYSFKVHNTTKDRITKLLASEDGKKYGPFDVGKKGIGPDETVTLVWDEKTDTSGCEWFIKAVFDDGSDTPAKKFDFCEEDLELEF